MFYKVCVFVCVFVCGSSLVFFSVCPQLRELYLYTKVRKKYNIIYIYIYIYIYYVRGL